MVANIVSDKMCLATCDTTDERMLNNPDTVCKASPLEILEVSFNCCTVRVLEGYKSGSSSQCSTTGLRYCPEGGGYGEEAAGSF